MYACGCITSPQQGTKDANSLEHWVRGQFRQYNKDMLTAALLNGSLPKALSQSIPHFLDRPLYASYRARKRTKVCTRLEHKIADRPDPDELVKKHILGVGVCVCVCVWVHSVSVHSVSVSVSVCIVCG
jgi:RPEL repeat